MVDARCNNQRRHKFTYNGKGKGRVLAIALLTGVQTRDQKCFTILEVAADWHKLMYH